MQNFETITLRFENSDGVVLRVQTIRSYNKMATIDGIKALVDRHFNLPEPEPPSERQAEASP